MLRPLTRHRPPARRALLVLAAVAASNAAADDATLDALRHDAWLHEVFFADAQRGWAVGDRGTIWHTDDGGRNWHPQRSGVTCPLYSVHFVDTQNGWAVGGWRVARTSGSHAVVLRTRDGGQRWFVEPAPLLPLLRRVRFFNIAQGFALGDASAIYPSGALVTEDGGRTWTPILGPAPGGWFDGHLLDLQTGAVLGYRSVTAAVRRRALEAPRSPSLFPRTARAIAHNGEGTLWLAGDGGLIMLSHDGGVNWSVPPGQVPPEAGEFFDFRAVAARGNSVWIAGAPGSRMLHSSDGGRTWQWLSTGQTLPLDSLHFVDQQHGWACGALGTILATRDAGRHWHVQRAGGTQLALLCLTLETASIPWEALAQAAGNEGYLCVAHCLGQRDVRWVDEDRLRLPARTHEAVVSLGGCGAQTAWQFPTAPPETLATPGDLLALWDEMHDGQGLPRLQEYLVRQIRMWRPEVVLTHAAAGDQQSPHAALLQNLVTQAAHLARDATRYTDHVATAELPAWEVKKLVGALPPGEAGQFHIAPTDDAPRLGLSLGDAATMPRAMAAAELPAWPARFGFRVLHTTLDDEVARRGLMSGVSLPPGGGARRRLPEYLPDVRQQRAAQQYRNVRALLQRVEDDPAASSNLAGQLGDLTAGLDAPLAARILYELGLRHARQGRGEDAADAFDALVQRYPQEPLSAAAATWLVQYWSSGEARHRWQRSQQMQVQQARLAVDNRTADSALGGTSVVTQAQHLALADPRSAEDRARRALELAGRVERTWPAVYAEPHFRFPLAVAQTRVGYVSQAERYYLAVERSALPEAWRACAAAERWLQHRQGLPPKPLALCVAGGPRPRLDGRLDDPLWQPVRPLMLRSPKQDDAQWGAQAYVASDGEFLYLAAVCRKAPGVEYPGTAEARQRDTDLSGRDRIEWLLDIDRDYATYYRLTVDHRGWPADSCTHDATWDPVWFIATHEDEQAWAVEAAIPLAELAPSVHRGRSVWGLGVQRIVPGAGMQSWTVPADPEPRPEGFGYLSFD
jgi:photosystem II stability/assembly factor-like uncharacterized protein/tetratricopeptide (TPR) repeat protein